MSSTPGTILRSPNSGAGDILDRQWLGVYDAMVAVATDPLNQGRVRLYIPQVLGTAYSAWAPPMQPGFVAPAVGTLCYALFLGGNPDLPQYFLGLTSTSLQAITNGTGNVLNTNPYIIGNNSTGWTATGGTVAAVSPNSDTDPPYVNALQLTASGSGGAAVTESAAPIAASGSSPYQVTSWVYYPAGGTVNVGMGFSNAGGTSLGTVTNTATVAAGVWTNVNTVVNSPSSAATGYPVVGPATTSTGSQFTAAAIQVLGQIPGALITPTSITSTQIASNTVTGTNIAGSTITASNIATGTITATQIQTGTITGSKIAGTTITGSNIATGTITAANITAGTITATQIAAGTVVAGIVDATTITGAQLIADGTSGNILVYSGAPAHGNLIASVSPMSGTDAHTNAYPAGIYATAGTIGGYNIATLGTEISNINAFLNQLNIASPPGATGFTATRPGTNSDNCGSQGAYGSLTLANLNDLVSFCDAMAGVVNDTIAYENALGGIVNTLITVCNNIATAVDAINTQLQNVGIFT